MRPVTFGGCWKKKTRQTKTMREKNVGHLNRAFVSAQLQRLKIICRYMKHIKLASKNAHFPRQAVWFHHKLMPKSLDVPPPRVVFWYLQIRWDQRHAEPMPLKDPKMPRGYSGQFWHISWKSSDRPRTYFVKFL